MTKLHNFSTFEHQLAADPAPVIDHSISVSGITTWKHHIMNNFYDWIDRISSGIPHLGSQNFMLKDVTLLEIIETQDNSDISIHFSFQVNGDKFFGNFKHLNYSQTPKFESEIKQYPEFSSAFIKRLEGLLLKIIFKIIEPDLGTYKVNQAIQCVDLLGRLGEIQPESRIKVTQLGSNFPKTIHFEYEGQQYRTRLHEFWKFKEKTAMLKQLVQRTAQEVERNNKHIAIF